MYFLPFQNNGLIGAQKFYLCALIGCQHRTAQVTVAALHPLPPRLLTLLKQANVKDTKTMLKE
jgi:hypothetical protein